jgi:DNA-binding protein H-NS
MQATAEKQDETQAAEANDTGLPARLQASLDDLSVGQLRSVQRYAEAKVRERAESEKAALAEEFRRRAEELGLSLRDLFGEGAIPAPAKRGRKPRGEGQKAERAPVAAKYRSPQGETWSGRGRAPKWLQVAEAERQSRDEFLISEQAA